MVSGDSNGPKNFRLTLRYTAALRKTRLELFQTWEDDNREIIKMPLVSSRWSFSFFTHTHTPQSVSWLMSQRDWRKLELVAASYTRIILVGDKKKISTESFFHFFLFLSHLTRPILLFPMRFFSVTIYQTIFSFFLSVTEYSRPFTRESRVRNPFMSWNENNCVVISFPRLFSSLPALSSHPPATFLIPSLLVPSHLYLLFPKSSQLVRKGEREWEIKWHDREGINPRDLDRPREIR